VWTERREALVILNNIEGHDAENGGVVITDKRINGWRDEGRRRRGG